MNKKTNQDTIPNLTPEESTIETSEQRSNNDSMPKSRIKRRLEAQSKKNLFFMVSGLICLLIILIVWGPTIIVQFSLLTAKNNPSETNSNKNSQIAYIAPPTFDSLPQATNSASIIISGQTIEIKQGRVNLYINDDLADIASIDKKGSFRFNDVSLKEGKNTIKAQVVIDKNKSNFSDSLSVMYIKEPPELEIEEPKDGDHYSGNNKTIPIKGKAGPGSKVTVNDYIAVTKSDGSFSYLLPLKDGDNHIKIVAIDEAGNKQEHEVKITYSP